MFPHTFGHMVFATSTDVVLQLHVNHPRPVKTWMRHKTWQLQTRLSERIWCVLRANRTAQDKNTNTVPPPAHMKTASLIVLCVHLHLHSFCLRNADWSPLSHSQRSFHSLLHTTMMFSNTEQKKACLIPSSVPKRESIQAVVISVTADVWLMSESVRAAAAHPCERCVDLRGWSCWKAPMSWLRSTPRCQPDQLAGECFDWMSGEHGCMWRHGERTLLISARTALSLTVNVMALLVLASVRVCECVHVHTSTLNKGITALSSAESAMNLLYNLCVMSWQIGVYCNKRFAVFKFVFILMAGRLPNGCEIRLLILCSSISSAVPEQFNWTAKPKNLQSTFLYTNRLNQ